MDKNKINDDEVLYRVVKRSYPNPFDKNGYPTASLFMDAGGASVDRDGGRSEDEIVDRFKEVFDKRYVDAVKIGAGECRRIGTYLAPVGNNTNKYHAEIRESESEIEVSLLKAMQLAAKSQRVGK